jgi:hypothetical protein|tara:strand:+ start:10737 stop:11063 length:327 start_codon:yes stop_codon:yes gene_type:complete
MGTINTGYRWSKSTRKAMLRNKGGANVALKRPKKSAINYVTPVQSTTVCPPRETYRPPSLDSGDAVAVKRDNQVYTGNSMKGIGTLHKSNAVPIFTDEEAKDQANMRR